VFELEKESMETELRTGIETSKFGSIVLRELFILIVWKKDNPVSR
jgi:hypothetical protein